MTESDPRTLGYFAGSRWFVGGLSAALIALLALVLLDALGEAQERSEKLMVELAWRNMRTGLQLAVGEALMHGREAETTAWIGGNPVRWLGAQPNGYVGDCVSEPEPGQWCFDAERRELVYQPRNHAHLKLLAPIAGRPEKQLRWRIAGEAKAGGGNGLVGLRVESVTPYEWFLG